MIYIVHNNEQIGPLSEDDARQKLSAGELGLTDLAWREGMAGWQPLQSVLDPQPASNASALVKRLSKHLPLAREWAGKTGRWLRASVSRPAFVMLWGCALLFSFKSCQMSSLSKRISEVQGTDFISDFIVSAIGVFVSPEPVTPFLASLSSLGGMMGQEATLEELRSAYQSAELWRELAVVLAVGTLLFIWFRSWRAKRNRAKV